MRQTPTRARRAGFTLVELLIVITIISILVALSAAAVVKVVGKGDEVRVRNEISQLNAAIQAFKTDFGVPYLPSRLVMPPGADPTGESQQYITTLWPRIGQNPVALANNQAAFQFWQHTGNSSVTLKGHQTLVFFLGGARDQNGAPMGFSASATNPMDTNPATSSSRKGPYYDFPLDRLSRLNQKQHQFPSFMDIYGTVPYIYFTAKKAGNDYDPTNDVQFGVRPYMTTTSRYANPNGFQIICAGKNGAFGTGGVSWAGAQGGGATADGADDMANFYATQLGIGP